MQGKRLIKLGDREYLVAETLGGEYAVYLTENQNIEGPLSFGDVPVTSHLGGYQGAHLEPGTLVVILARVAAPAEETEEIEIERRYYYERHWEPISWELAMKALHKYPDLEVVRQDLVNGHTINTDISQYRRRERD